MGEHNVKSKFCASVVCFGLLLLAVELSAASLTWVPETGGALDDPANWNVTTINPEDGLRIRKAQSDKLYLNGDLTVSAFNFGFAGVDVVGTMDLGKDHTLALETLSVLTGAVMRLTSGTITCSGSQYVGLNGGNVRMVVDGQDAKYKSTTQLTLGHGSDKLPGGGNQRIEILNGATFEASVRMGHTASYLNSLLVSGSGTVWDMAATAASVGYVDGSWGNTVTIADGARVTGDIVVGAGAGSVSNTLVMAGAGTTWTRSDDILYLGGYERANFSSFVVSNRASYVSGFNIALGKNKKGTTNLSDFNRLSVLDGATVEVPMVEFGSASNVVEVAGTGSELVLNSTAATEFFLGNFGAGNELILRDGGKFSLSGTLKNLRIRKQNAVIVDGGAFDLYGDLRLGAAERGAHDARVEIKNSGTFVASGNDSLYVGHEVFASNNVFAVLSGGSFSFASDAGADKTFVVGNRNTCGNELLVDGGTFDIGEHKLNVGNDINEEGAGVYGGNRVVVRNGGKLTAGAVRFGYKLPNSTFVLENATVDVSTLEASHEAADGCASASNTVVRVGGTNVSFTATGSFALSKTTTLVIDVAGPQMKDAMITAERYSFAEGAKIRITSSADLSEVPNFTATVLKSTNKDIDLSNVDFEIDPDCGLALASSDAKTLVLKHKLSSGMMLIFR